MLKASFLLRETSKRFASLSNFKMVWYFFFVCVPVCMLTHTHIGGGQKTAMWGPAVELGSSGLAACAFIHLSHHTDPRKVFFP